MFRARPFILKCSVFCFKLDQFLAIRELETTIFKYIKISHSFRVCIKSKMFEVARFQCLNLHKG